MLSSFTVAYYCAGPCPPPLVPGLSSLSCCPVVFFFFFRPLVGFVCIVYCLLCFYPPGADGAAGCRQRPGERRRGRVDAASLRLRRRSRQLRERPDREGRRPDGHDAGGPETDFSHRDGEGRLT